MAEKRKLRKTSAWQRLKRRWNRKGVLEIDVDHPGYNELCCIRQGIREVLSYPQLGPKDDLKPEDYEHVLEKTMSINGKTYQFCSYASAVFATMRRAIDVDEEEYQKSLAPPEALPYLEFHSNSRSGQNFYLSTDMQYFLKTDYKKSITFFLSILRPYLAHFQSNPHSLLVKFLGLYSIKTSGSKQKYFLVMQSVFFPSDRMEVKYDVKGCFAGRYEKPSAPGSVQMAVLKDQNFWRESIDLGPQREWFLQTVETDSTFLSNLGVIDYSLLIGRQHIRSDERRESISNLVCRVQKSLYDPATGLTESLHTVTSILKVGEKSSENREATPDSLPGSVEDLDTSRSDSVVASHSAVNQSNPSGRTSQAINGTPVVNGAKPKPSNGNSLSVPAQKSGNSAPTKKGKLESGKSAWKEVNEEVVTPRSTLVSLTNTSYLDNQEAVANRRLLPNCKNSLHIIDGPKHRYFMGIIDFLTEYGVYQKLDAMRKDIKYGCGDHSTLPPEPYAQRFQRFIRERTN